MPGRGYSPDDPRGESRRREHPSRRSYGEEGRYSSDQARYYGADNRSFEPLATHRPRDERPEWRRGRYEAGRSPDAQLPYDQEDALTRGYYSLDGPHGGQEYGIEPHGYRESVVRRRPRAMGRGQQNDRVPYGDQSIDAHDPGVRRFGPPADYAYHPGPEIEFELDYLDWREEQLRSHDREYAAWRGEQQRRYDDDYRAFRDQGRYRRSFDDWRRQAQDPLTAPYSEGRRPPDDKV